MGVNMSCKVIKWDAEVKRPLGSESRVLFELRDGDGFVAVARRWEDSKEKGNNEQRHVLSRQPVLLINKKHPKGMPLPIQDVENIGARRAAYSEYAGKYTFIGAMPKDSAPGQQTNWPEHKPQPVYLMSRNGEVEIRQIPKTTEWTGIFLAMPSHAGLVFWGAHGRTGGGVFLYDGENVLAIDRGYVGSLSVTPDGCKVAYPIINNYGRTRDHTFRVKYANLCE
jgi:hypothetical protein